MERERLDKIVDRSATVAGKGHSGQLKTRTREEYARLWAEAETWCRSTGRSVGHWTSDALADYAAHLVTSGYALATARKRLSAVRARHRLLGRPVPDDVAAWFVLRAAYPTPSSIKVKPADRATVVRLLDTCDLDRNAGRRDACLITLVWDLLLPAEALLAVNVEDVMVHADGLVVRLRDADGQPRHPPGIVGHDEDPPLICPVEAMARWIDALAAASVTTGALFRPVDRFDSIARTGAAHAGPRSRDDRLNVRSLGTIWAAHIARAGVGPCTPRALRVGGARDDVDHGTPVRDVLTRGGWSPRCGGIITTIAVDGGQTGGTS